MPKNKNPLQINPEKSRNNNHCNNKKDHQQTSSWDQIKNLLTCKQIDTSTTTATTNHNYVTYSKLSSCSSIWSFRDVVLGNTRVVHRADNSPENSTVGQETGTTRRKTVHNNTSGGLANSSRSTTSLTNTTSMRSNGGGGTHRSSTSKGMQFRKLSGCYECHMAHMIVDPSRYT